MLNKQTKKQSTFSATSSQPQFKQSLMMKLRLQTMCDSLATLKAENDQLQKDKQSLQQINQMYIDGRQEKIVRSRISNIEQKQETQLLKRMEREYKAMTKHCLAIQQQNKFLKSELERYEVIKKQLAENNLTDINQLHEDYRRITAENRQLRVDLNASHYECQLVREEINRYTTLTKQFEEQCEEYKREISLLKAQINRNLQESQDDINKIKKKHYQLTVRCHSLEKEASLGRLGKIQAKQREDHYKIGLIEAEQKIRILKRKMSEQSEHKPRKLKIKRSCSALIL